MANEILYSSFGDLRLTETLNAMLWALLYDKTDLLSLSVDLGDQAGRGSLADKVPQVKWDDPMVSVAENAATSNVALEVASKSVTVARQALQRQVSDQFVISAPAGSVDVESIVMDMVNAAILRRTDMIAALSSGFSVSVGATTVDVSVDTVFDGLFRMNLNRAPTDLFLVAHPEQWNDIVSDLRGETGPLQFAAASVEQLQAKGPGYKGRWLGIDIFDSDSVNTANGGTDYLGIFGCRGAFAHKHAAVNSVVGISPALMRLLPAGSPIFAEFERDAATGLTKIVGNYYLGVTELEDNRAVGFLGDKD